VAQSSKLLEMADVFNNFRGVRQAFDALDTPHKLPPIGMASECSRWRKLLF